MQAVLGNIVNSDKGVKGVKSVKSVNIVNSVQLYKQFIAQCYLHL